MGSVTTDFVWGLLHQLILMKHSYTCTGPSLAPICLRVDTWGCGQELGERRADGRVGHSQLVNFAQTSVNTRLKIYTFHHHRWDLHTYKIHFEWTSEDDIGTNPIWPPMNFFGLVIHLFTYTRLKCILNGIRKLNRIRKVRHALGWGQKIVKQQFRPRFYCLECSIYFSFAGQS